MAIPATDSTDAIALLELVRSSRGYINWRRVREFIDSSKKIQEAGKVFSVFAFTAMSDSVHSCY